MQTCPNKAAGPDGLCTEHAEAKELKKRQKQLRKEERELVNCPNCLYPDHLCRKHWIATSTRVAQEREQDMKQQLANLNVDELTVAAARRAECCHGTAAATVIQSCCNAECCNGTAGFCIVYDY